MESKALHIAHLFSTVPLTLASLLTIMQSVLTQVLWSSVPVTSTI
jgi:hypothetical protein